MRSTRLRDMATNVTSINPVADQREFGRDKWFLCAHKCHVSCDSYNRRINLRRFRWNFIRFLCDKFRWYFFNFQPTIYKKMVYLLSRQFLRWSDNLRSGIIRITITPINLCYSLNYDRWAYGRRPMNRGTHHPCLRKCLTNGKFIRAIWQWQMDDSAPPRFLVWKDLFEKLPR